MRGVKIAPSILSADLMTLQSEIESVAEDADWLHIDIMDGHFVPNLTFGPCMVKAIRRQFPHLFLDCHLMTENPHVYIDSLSQFADQVTFHFEAELNPDVVCQQIRKAGMRSSVSIKPGTDVKVLEPLLKQKLVDNVLIMTVEPGFGGQKFITGMHEKIKWVREICPDTDIQVDGGIDETTIGVCAKAGANIFVAGTAIFGRPCRATAIKQLRSLACLPWSRNKEPNTVALKNEACEAAYAVNIPPPNVFELRGRTVVKLLCADNAGLVIQTIGRVQKGDISSLYQIEPVLLGSGRAAQVRLATHRMTGKRAAMKSFLKRTGKVNYMRNEAQVALRIDHPHIARLLEVWEDNFAVHFVMEYCPDGDLLQWINRRFKCFTPDAEFYKANEEVARVLVTQIIRVISHLHREQLVSRDLKPEHFMIDGCADSLISGQLKGIPHLKLIDLGLARSFSPDSRPMRVACGSLPFVAPEVLLGNYTTQCDLWSLGCIMYMLLTGDPPFFGSESEMANQILDPNYKVTLPPKCAAAVSSECKDLLNRLLVPSPTERLDAESAFRHPWILRPSPIPQSLPQTTKASLARFVDASKRVPGQKFFRKVVMSLMAFSLSSDETCGLSEIFLQADHGGTGVLNPSDVESLLTRIDPTIPRSQAAMIAESMDIFDRGGIYYNDFICCFLGTYIPMDEARVRLTFWKFDRSRTGHVSVENMRQVLGTLYSDRVLERFIRESDRDGDKYIDYEEFVWILDPNSLTGLSEENSKTANDRFSSRSRSRSRASTQR